MMGPDLSRIALYVRPGSTDMRKQINGLALIAEQQINGEPLSGALYLFCNREQRILKALCWDRTGFTMWTTRLERDRFSWPTGGQAALETTGEQLRMLLDGIDFWHAHQPLHYRQVL